MPRHPSHATRSSDAGSFDEVCVRCGANDEAGVGWGALAHPCYVPIPEDWEARLPALMLPEHRYLHLKAVGAEQIAALMDWRERRKAAEASTWAFCETVGAVGYWPPDHYEENRTAHLFAFKEKPEDKAWKVLKPRAKDTHFKAHANKKNEAGLALVERMAACVPYPSENEIGAMLGAIYNVSYHDVDAEEGTGSRGSGTVGSGFTATAYLEYAGDTLIVRLDNPMPKLKEMMAWTKDRSFAPATEPEAPAPRFQFVGSRHGEALAATYDIAGWRPPEGYEMISQAEHDLIFAQFRVEQERQQAA